MRRDLVSNLIISRIINEYEWMNELELIGIPDSIVSISHKIWIWK